MLQYRLALGSTMKQRGIPFLEVRELTEEAYPSNEGWFGERIHPNHMGHRLIASELLKLIGSQPHAERLENTNAGSVSEPGFYPVTGLPEDVRKSICAFSTLKSVG